MKIGTVPKKKNVESEVRVTLPSNAKTYYVVMTSTSQLKSMFVQYLSMPRKPGLRK